MRVRRALQNARRGRLVTLGLLLACLSILACGHDPNVAPIVARGSATLQLGFVGGELAAPVMSVTADCPTPTPGFAEAVRVRLTVIPPSGTAIERQLSIPANTASSGMLVDGLTPGTGYRFVIAVERSADGELIFTGTLDNQDIRPGVRELLRIELVPTARRVVLGIGQARSVSADQVVVPIMVSHSLPLRGIQFDLCFDDTLVEVVELDAIGRLAAAEFDGVAGGEVLPETPFRVVLWSTDSEHRLPAGQGAVVELTMQFLAGSGGVLDLPLIFTDAIITDQADPGQNFVVYFFDGEVTR